MNRETSWNKTTKVKNFLEFKTCLEIFDKLPNNSNTQQSQEKSFFIEWSRKILLMKISRDISNNSENLYDYHSRNLPTVEGVFSFIWIKNR